MVYFTSEKLTNRITRIRDILGTCLYLVEGNKKACLLDTGDGYGNLKEYEVTIMACVPAIYEKIFMMIRKKLEKQEKLQEILENEEKYKTASMEEKKEMFKEIHDMLGGKIKLFISGAAALDKTIESRYRLLGINLVQGYGLTETSPVVAVGTNKYYKIIFCLIPGIGMWGCFRLPVAADRDLFCALAESWFCL